MIASAETAHPNDDLAGQVEALLSGERDWLANLANVTALLAWHLREINRVGF